MLTTREKGGVGGRVRRREERLTMGEGNADSSGE